MIVATSSLFFEKGRGPRLRSCVSGREGNGAWKIVGGGKGGKGEAHSSSSHRSFLWKGGCCCPILVVVADGNGKSTREEREEGERRGASLLSFFSPGTLGGGRGIEF